MLNVMNKNNGDVVEVYDITYDKNSYPRFLVYKDGQWVRLSAKHFAPIDENIFKAI